MRLADYSDQDDVEVSQDNESLVAVPILSTTSHALEVGKRDLVAELDSPVLNDFGVQIPPNATNAYVTRDFV